VKAIVAERGQVTIPKDLRERLGIAHKTVLDFREENGKLVAEKVPQEDPVSQVMGRLKLEKSTREILSDLRDQP